LKIEIRPGIRSKYRTETRSPGAGKIRKLKRSEVKKKGIEKLNKNFGLQRYADITIQVYINN